MLSRLFLAWVVAVVVIGCDSLASPDPEWTCTVSLEAETATQVLTGSATATGSSREAAESTARAQICSNATLGLSGADRSRCEQLGAAPQGFRFLSWRMESSCTTD